MKTEQMCYFWSLWSVGIIGLPLPLGPVREMWRQCGVLWVCARCAYLWGVGGLGGYGRFQLPFTHMGQIRSRWLHLNLQPEGGGGSAFRRYHLWPMWGAPWLQTQLGLGLGREELPVQGLVAVRFTDLSKVFWLKSTQRWLFAPFELWMEY